ncbi:ABC transporter substrate-binding protein [Tessaracoccus caeni]|uniref:ABC transporter substrate-binding protein n=1 Tax=Tessaracoccus caeni TaxID=3031239 RepID=UPI0023DAF563|nr:ABC transporter substrate-binding protein [Tessaracoccus caeni]MDF1488282.1 ABC transporter substrate-binding protein [Tessaracoccus caeni]
MKLKRSIAPLAVLLSGALALGACTSDAEPDDNAGTAAPSTSAGATESGDAPAPTDDPCQQDVGITATADGQVSFSAGPGNWSGYNSTTFKTYSTYNSVITAHMFSSFVYFGVDGTVCENKEFGSFEVTNEDPLTVKYTISPDAVWSDGTPVTINDYLLDWAAQNPEFLVPGFASGENPDAKVVFDHVSNSLAGDVPEGPQGEVGSKEFTVVYKNPNPDYRLMIGSALPAHVAAKQSGIEPDALAKAILDRDADTVKKVAKFWNEGWAYKPGELPENMEEVVPSSGPYKLKADGWIADTSLTLEANPTYWGVPAGTKDLVFRFIDDAQMAQSLQNGDVQVINPQPTVDTVPQLEAIGPSVNVLQYSTLTWEHLDFNFRENNVFGNNETGAQLREAFAYCVPRQQIVDTLIKPINAETVLMNAREVFPFQEDYQSVVDAAYDGRFDVVDVAKSKELVDSSGVTTPIEVRIGYRAGNERRAQTVDAIAASCKDAGFNVTHANQATFFEEAYPAGDWELALFAWAGSGQIASGQNIYASNGGQNLSEYRNDTVDAAWKTLASSLDPAVHKEQVKVIETELWKDLFGIPLYAHPGVAAHDAKVANVRSTATQDQVSWNAPQWVLK